MHKFPLKLSTQKLTILAILLALNIVLGYFTLNIFAFSFGFATLAVVLMSEIAGPFWCGTLLALADILQDILHGWPLNPLFSIGAGIMGLMCGFFYYQRQLSIKKRQDWLKVLSFTLANVVLVNILINSFALALQTSASLTAIFLASLLNLISVPLLTILILVMMEALQKIPQIRKFLATQEKR